MEDLNVENKHIKLNMFVEIETLHNVYFVHDTKTYNMYIRQG